MVKRFSETDPKNMDLATLEAFAAEGWAEFILVRGVLIYGSFVLAGFSLTTLIVTGTIEADDMAFNFPLAVLCGLLYGTFLRYAITSELRRRR